MVDAHCHLDLYPNFQNLFEECDRQSIYTLTVTTTPKAWPRNRDLAAKSKCVRAALGLHPQLVSERAEELKLWEMYLPEARYIGEVGLDAGPRFYRSLDLQKKVFERVLKLCAQAGNKILTVHSTRAASAVISMLEKHLPKERGQVVLHWFTGSISEAKRALELGCYFSINAEMLKNARYDGLIKVIPLERLLTETDGPFCQNQGRAIYPSDVSIAVKLLSRVKKVEPASIAATIFSNFMRIDYSFK